MTTEISSCQKSRGFAAGRARYQLSDGPELRICHEGRHGGVGFPSAAQGTGQQVRSRRAFGPLSGRVAQAAIRGNNSEKSQLNSARMPGHCRRRQSAADVSSLSFRGRPAQQLAAVGRCDARPGNCRGRRAMDPAGARWRGGEGRLRPGSAGARRGLPTRLAVRGLGQRVIIRLVFRAVAN